MIFHQIWKPFIHKEKILIILAIFIFMNISLWFTFQQSIFSEAGYETVYPNAGLEFFYYIHAIGINAYHFICIMLLIPNLVSSDFLNMYQSKSHYMIETRISKKSYYHYVMILNLLMSFITVLILEISILFIIHIFYLPIRFNTMTYPELYHAMSIIVFNDEIYNLIAFCLMTSLGYTIVSGLIFTLQWIITNPYIYRCSGVIIGIILVVSPALIQGYLPVPDFAFLLQINNLVCLGIEGMVEPPFQLSYPIIYLYASIIYIFITWCSYYIFMKWRNHYD